MPLADCLTIGRLAHAPMLFALWINTGTESVIAAHPGWLQLVHARPADMHLFLLWLRSTLMFAFALLCRDVTTMIHWKTIAKSMPVGSSAAAAAAPVLAGGVSSVVPATSSQQLTSPAISAAAPSVVPSALLPSSGRVRVDIDMPTAGGLTQHHDQLQQQPQVEETKQTTQQQLQPSSITPPEGKQSHQATKSEKQDQPASKKTEATDKSMQAQA